MAQKNKTARVIKRSAEMIHSDSELATKMEPAVQAPEAGPSNTELIENSHAENGASPVLDGDLKSPERANVNAMREALETQSEMEVGKPIAEKQEEIKAEEAGKTMEIDAQPGKQIIINIASWDYPTKKAAFLNPKTARFLTIDEVKKAGREFLNTIRTAAVEVAQGEDAKGFHMLIKMNGREYALYGQDADDFRRDYAAIPKPQDKVNALVEKYMWKMQPYGYKPKPRPAQPAKVTQTPESKQPDIPAYLKKQQQEENPKGTKQNPDIPAYLKRKEMEEGYTRYGVPQNNYASLQKKAYVSHCPGHTNSKGEKAEWCIKQHDTNKILESFKSKEDAVAGLRNMEGHKNGTQKTADYEGWTNWSTWHVNLLIDNTEASYSTKRRLVQNALRKGITLDQLASQFSRMFHKQYKETKEFHDNNALDAKDERSRIESKRLETLYGEPQSSGNQIQDIVDGLMGVGYEMGMKNGWEEPFEEVNWREIAEHALENEREEGSVPEEKQKAPEFSKEDKDYLAEMKIKGSKEMDKNKKKANPMDTAVEPMAPITIPSAPETPEINEPQDEITDPVLVREVAEELFPGFDFADLGASEQRDVVAIARERKNEMAMMACDSGTAKNLNDIEKEAGFNFFFPGQVTKEFYPELMHEIVDFPNASNAPMGVETPEIVGDGGDQQALEQMLDEVMGGMGAVETIQLPGDVSDIEEVQFEGMNTASDEKSAYVSTSPAGAMGIGRDGKEQVLEGVPLRKENDIRGPMFTEEFYGQYEGISGDSLSAMASLKAKRAANETDVDQFAMFLKKVVGEIAATFIAAFKVTSRPLLDKVPGVGEVQLQYVEQPQGMSAFNTVNTGSRVKYLMDKLNDSEIQDAINDAWAQAAVWHDGGKGGYVYEVFVRAESIDTDSMIMKYKFVAGTKE